MKIISTIFLQKLNLALTFAGLAVSCPLYMELQAQPSDRIFFSSFRPEGHDLYVSTDYGQTFSRFTEHPSLDYDAVITPDGQSIVFTSERGGHPQLYIKSIHGKDEARLLVSSRSMQDQAVISPDGRWILFVSSHEGNADIFRLPFRPDTCLEVVMAENLTRHTGGDFRPSYSPDGHTITFSSDRANPIRPNPVFSFARHRTGNIFSMDSVGQNVKQLTFGKEWEGSPKWTKDGSTIYYYNFTEGTSSIWSMRPDGSGQKQITPNGTNAFSPCPLPDGKLGFTSWQGRGDDEFRVLTYDTLQDQTDTIVKWEMGMFHLDAHPDGIMVFHGGKLPEEKEINKGGFRGDLLIQNQPSLDTLGGRSVNLFGVRRAFVAPAFPQSPYLIIDHINLESISDAFSPWFYVMLLYPLFTLFLFGKGVYQSIRHRKEVASVRFLLGGLAALLVVAIVIGLCFYLFMEARWPLWPIRGVMAGLSVSMMLFAWYHYRKSRKRKAAESKTHLVSRFYVSIFSSAAIAALYLALCLHLLLDFSTHFAKVNYLTQEVTPLFDFKIGVNSNPSFSQFIDGRVTSDEKRFLFTIGGFGAAAHHQGDIWSYDFESGKMVRLADSPVNDGFGDMSHDGKRMVFRSSRSGVFDVYVQDENGLVQITQDTFKENFPSISPQGNRIVYASDKEGVAVPGGPRTFDLFLHERQDDGSWSDPVQLTNGEGQHAHPSFSPDGEWIIYTTEAYGIMDEQALIQTYFFSPQMYGEIVALRLRDGYTMRLTHNKWEEGAPQWVNGI